ncbi:transmembrane receptor, eukaryota [Emericellopsis atlantica]|uniref:Transmembrane receptor, eukaryota n=1 Tax=Emericellopsis atlantica TaxID=2614577 RepID=A0A9P7ZNZ0_9HYPO|nr:transmembrane receptor, eukaryota [Emericellopsis atlantica]KAG9255197.1 transmembrane receptor, eukaryota [Emericellopsis atlantica]
MKSLMGLLAAGLFLWTAQAMEILMNEQDESRQYCAGMYGKKTWGGPVDPFILVKYLDADKDSGDDPITSMVIFEWRDRDLVGIPDPDGWGNRLAICNDDYVKDGLCDKKHIGEFVLAANATDDSRATIVTKAVHLKDSEPIKYMVKKTGYYCIVTDPWKTKKYSAVVEFRNAYGELAATQIPKLPFYGAMTIVYTLLAGYWGFLYYQHRQDILPVQNYITAILGFLVIEMLLTWAFYDYQNRNGSNVGSKVFLVIVGILNAARNSFSFFLLLIVCMGYGVVKHTLGRAMIWARWLAAAHFVFGLVYSVTSLLISPEAAGPFVLLIVLPLAATLTAFYIWTLNSMNATLKDLRERKQHVKESMYRKLWWAILASLLVIFAFFFFNSFTFASVGDPDFVPFHWKTRWFVLDGWLNLVYFADIAWIAYIWRPTANNRRFAMSDEIAQDDDGNFEIGDIGMPDDSDDEEAAIGKGDDQHQHHQPQQQGVGMPSAGLSNPGQSSGASGHRAIPRESVDGETLFAVGDEDKFSDDGSDEDAKLVKSK